MDKDICKVECDVCNCVHNLNGCKCNKDGIKITMDNDNENAHYCKSYEKKCGFME